MLDWRIDDQRDRLKFTGPCHKDRGFSNTDATPNSGESKYIYNAGNRTWKKQRINIYSYSGIWYRFFCNKYSNILLFINYKSSHLHCNTKKNQNKHFLLWTPCVKSFLKSLFSISYLNKDSKTSETGTRKFLEFSLICNQRKTMAAGYEKYTDRREIHIATLGKFTHGWSYPTKKVVLVSIFSECLFSYSAICLSKSNTDSRSIFKTQTNIQDGTFSENFCKKIHLGCMAGFWIRLCIVIKKDFQLILLSSEYFNP